MNPEQLSEWTSENFDRELARAGVPVLVDFYAPWCGPCRMLAPVLTGLAAQFAGRIRFAKVNVDEAPDLAQRFEIAGVPTLLFFRDGEPCDEVVGLPSPGALASRLEQWTTERGSTRVPSTPGGSCCR